MKVLTLSREGTFPRALNLSYKVTNRMSKKLSDFSSKKIIDLLQYAKYNIDVTEKNIIDRGIPAQQIVIDNVTKFLSLEGVKDASVKVYSSLAAALDLVTSKLNQQRSVEAFSSFLSYAKENVFSINAVAWKAVSEKCKPAIDGILLSLSNNASLNDKQQLQVLKEKITSLLSTIMSTYEALKNKVGTSSKEEYSEEELNGHNEEI
eukprot:TRINITY_DN3703_c0_g1_i3.p1 TRINITY_DN3703_c0_g1~~TRINITY_DN3703_c0_g1_i3.p1  ORF type:complete len:206 (-),score=39.10 TRINITY_DN3703_c0_g1_i3:25-642(-)